MYIPREIIEKTFREGGQSSRTRLLGRNWRDLRTREELEEELEKPIELEDILLWSRKTGKDFVIYGQGFPYKVQKKIEKDLLNPYYRIMYAFGGGFFTLIGNATDNTFVELYSYIDRREGRGSIVVLKKTSPMSSLREVFNNLFYPLEQIDRRDLTGIAYDNEEVFEFEDTYSDSGEDPLVKQILDKAYYKGVYPAFAWSEEKEIVVEGITHIDSYQTDVFHGHLSYREPVYIDREVAEYILSGRVAYSISVEDAVREYLLPEELQEQFAKLLALKDDPRPELSERNLLPKRR